MRAVLLALVLLAVPLTGCLETLEERFGNGAGPLEEEYAPGWPAPGDAAVRPGVKIVGGGTFSGTCTANFVFSSPGNRTLYIGTASHCVTGMSLGDPVEIAGGEVTGTVVYCSWGTVDQSQRCTEKSGTGGTSTNEQGWENDFALIEIPDEARDQVHPALVHWGGPTRLAGPPSVDTHVLTYGNTPLRDADRQDAPDTLDPREGYVTESSQWTTIVVLAPASVSGDSGSPVITADGSTVGVMQTLGPGYNGVVNLQPALAYLHENTELDVELKTWRMMERGALPDEPPLRPGL